MKRASAETRAAASDPLVVLDRLAEAAKRYALAESGLKARTVTTRQFNGALVELVESARAYVKMLPEGKPSTPAARPSARGGLRRARDESVGARLKHGGECGGKLYKSSASGYYLCASCDAAGRDALVSERSAELDMGERA